MADIEGIARKIYDIIISPDTVTGLINGGLSVPLDYGYLIYGIFDTDTRYERETERIRMMTAIRHDILNYENIVNAVKLIFQLFNKYLSESEQDRIYRSVVTSIVGRISMRAESPTRRSGYRCLPISSSARLRLSMSKSTALLVPQ